MRRNPFGEFVAYLLPDGPAAEMQLSSQLSLVPFPALLDLWITSDFPEIFADFQRK
jgi:hypothetical protein